MEELGDARVRCEQLKGYVDEATDLIEKSEHRDHFFEVAGHLMHGIPEVLFKLEKALEAASMAASRIDYEEIKERLKPEKVEELEKALQDVRIRRLHRSDGTPQVQDAGKKDKNATLSKEAVKFKFRVPVDPTTVKEVAKRLQDAGIDAHDGTEHIHGTIEVEGETEGHAQDAAAHKINQAAGFKVVLPREQHKVFTKSGKEVSPMNAKLAAYELVRIADHVDRTGTVPMDKLVSLIRNLEKGKREASASGANPKKVAGYFRALAENVINTAADPNPANKPSRFALAQSLRRVVADQMPMTSAQVAAQIYQQSNSRDEVMKGFKESNPDLTEAQLKEIADQWEANKDVIKEKHE